MTVKQEIEKILQERFAPASLEVINESYKHAGHAGDDGSGESHFRIVISGAIPGNTRLEKHRNIIEGLGRITKHIHAIQIELK